MQHLKNIMKCYDDKDCLSGCVWDKKRIWSPNQGSAWPWARYSEWPSTGALGRRWRHWALAFCLNSQQGRRVAPGGRDSSIAPHRTCSTPQFFAIFKIWFHSGSVSYIISLQDFCSTTRQCKLRRVLRQVCNTKSVVKPACLCLCLFFPCLLPLVILSVLAPPALLISATVSKKQAVHHTPPHNR